MTTAICGSCGATAPLPTAPTDKTRVIGEPSGWGVATVQLANLPMRSTRLCGPCSLTVARAAGIA